MFERVLVANRGEIALRVIRALKELGVSSAVVHSDADTKSRPVKEADLAMPLGGVTPLESYLNIEKVVAACKEAGADAVHPGYGFLSENSNFARALAKENIKFIGPPPDVLDKLGDKIEARRLMKAAGVPMVPGGMDPVDNLQAAKEEAEQIGYPVIIKAVGGGGGRGMRVVKEPEGLEAGFNSARAEAEGAFGNPEVYLERYVGRGRHIEFQILGDEHGNVRHLAERECSLQRRHQKLIEEAPSAVITPEIREQMGARVVGGMEAAGYMNAGTVEFLYEDGEFFFLEVNPRIQVEHPVTEMVTGKDIARWQIRVAAGEKIDFAQSEVKLNGHAIEARINAEDVLRGFAPSPGKIRHLETPQGRNIRFDSHIEAGYSVPGFYDSMLGKLICWGEDRQAAMDRLRFALRQLNIGGFPTLVGFHQRLLDHPNVQRAEFHSHWLEANLDDVLYPGLLVSEPLYDEQTNFGEAVALEGWELELAAPGAQSKVNWPSS